jgi:acetylornithine deacetylase/succinyl-diaminopimelate desuccinylase-like protein
MRPLIAGLLALLMSAPAFGADLREEVSNYRAAHETAIVGQLDELTRLRSVAADPQGLAAAAVYLQSLLKTRGFETQAWSSAGSPPVVYGVLKSPGAKRTAIFYAHYDGQPVTRAQWSSDPFVP